MRLFGVRGIEHTTKISEKRLAVNVAVTNPSGGAAASLRAGWRLAAAGWNAALQAPPTHPDAHISRGQRQEQCVKRGAAARCRPGDTPRSRLGRTQ